MYSNDISILEKLVIPTTGYLFRYPGYLVITLFRTLLYCPALLIVNSIEDCDSIHLLPYHGCPLTL